MMILWSHKGSGSGEENPNLKGISNIKLMSDWVDVEKSWEIIWRSRAINDCYL